MSARRELIDKIANKCVKAFYSKNKEGGPVRHDWALDWFGENINAEELTEREYTGLLEDFYKELVDRGFVGMH